MSLQSVEDSMTKLKTVEFFAIRMIFDDEGIMVSVTNLKFSCWDFMTWLRIFGSTTID